MDLKIALSDRISISLINRIVSQAEHDNEYKQELYNLLLKNDDIVAYNAGWILTHFSSPANEWLYERHNELVDKLLICKNAGKRRFLLTLIFKQPLSGFSRTDLLDFCLTRMLSKREMSGVRSLCMKIAYEVCLSSPELKQELKNILEMMEGSLSPAMHSTRKNILKAMSKNKSLQNCRKTS